MANNIEKFAKSLFNETIESLVKGVAPNAHLYFEDGVPCVTGYADPHGKVRYRLNVEDDEVVLSQQGAFASGWDVWWTLFSNGAVLKESYWLNNGFQYENKSTGIYVLVDSEGNVEVKSDDFDIMVGYEEVPEYDSEEEEEYFENYFVVRINDSEESFWYKTSDGADSAIDTALQCIDRIEANGRDAEFLAKAFEAVKAFTKDEEEEENL